MSSYKCSTCPLSTVSDCSLQWNCVEIMSLKIKTDFISYFFLLCAILTKIDKRIKFGTWQHILLKSRITSHNVRKTIPSSFKGKPVQSQWKFPCEDSPNNNNTKTTTRISKYNSAVKITLTLELSGSRKEIKDLNFAASYDNNQDQVWINL